MRKKVKTTSKAALCSQLLIYAGRSHAQIVPVALSSFLEEIRELAEASDPASVTFRLEPAGELPVIRADAVQLRQAILNLKGVLDKYDIPFPAIPEVGITGEEINDVEMEDIIPVF